MGLVGHGGLAVGDVVSHGFDFDVEVGVGGGVEVADGDHADEGFFSGGFFDDWQVANATVGHEVAGLIEVGVEVACDDFFGHDVRDLGGLWVEFGGDDTGEDVAF